MQFLTRLPTGKPVELREHKVAYSLLWYPVVGLVIGLLLQGLVWLLPVQSASLFTAALVLAAWVFITGALHLDGLGDTADAWVGGLGDSQRTLDIMKDPASGPVAVVVLTVTLLVKLAALQALLGTGFCASLWAVPVLSRGLVLLGFLTTPYVRKQGLGTGLGDLPSSTAIQVLAAGCVLLLVFLPFSLWFIWLFTAGAFFLLWRRAMLQRLQGFTGDCAGALIELGELVLLVSGVLLVALL